MPQCKIVVFFNAGKSGFSEVYYRDLTTVTGGFETKPVFDLVKARTALCAAGRAATDDKGPRVDVQPEAVRISVVGTPNKGRLYEVDPNIQDANKTNPAEMAGTRGLMMTMYTADNAHRRVSVLRGLPAEWVNEDLSENKQIRLLPKMLKLVDAFKAALAGTGGLGNGWLMKVRIRTVKAGLTGGIAFARTTGGYLQLSMSTGLATVGETILIRGARGVGLTGVNGVMHVTDITGSGTLYTTDKRVCDPCLGSALVLAPKAKVYSLSDDYLPIVAAFESGWADRKTGRAFFVRPGKRPACCR